jgi:hypothetical protein
VDGPDDRGNFVGDIVNILTVTAARVVNGDQRISRGGELFDLPANRIFIIEMDNNRKGHTDRPFLFYEQLYFELAQINDISVRNRGFDVGRQPAAIQIGTIGGTQVHEDDFVLDQAQDRVKA